MRIEQYQKIFSGSLALVLVLISLLPASANSDKNVQAAEPEPEAPACYAIGVHDGSKNNSQLLTISEPGLSTAALGPVYSRYDIEAMASHPATGELYAIAGDGGRQDGNVYLVDPSTGGLTKIGNTRTREEIVAASFHPDGTLWAFEEERGLVTVDLDTGLATRVWNSAGDWEGLAWDSEGRYLYGADHKKLYRWDSQTKRAAQICPGVLPDETEALEFNQAGRLIGGAGNKIFAVDPVQCTSEIIATTGAYNDIEALTFDSCQVDEPGPEPDPDPDNPEGTPWITFTFDDARLGIRTRGAPTLNQYDIKATYYGVTDYISDSYFKNMTWDDVDDLYSKFGWDIANHTKSHLRLTTLSDSQVREQIEKAHQAFVAHSVTPTSFAYPFGAVDDRVIDIVSDYYPVARGVKGQPNQLPLLSHQLKSYGPKYDEPAESVIAVIDQAIQKGQWLILRFHNIVTDNPEPFEYPQTELDKVARYIAESGYETLTMTEALLLAKGNKVKNGDFDDADGSWVKYWTRSNPDAISVIDSDGAYPTTDSAVFFDGSATKDVIRSSRVLVQGNKRYLLSAFMRLENFVKGGQAIWLNEYDSKGKWLSGQWLGGQYSNFIGAKTFLYEPSSVDVSTVQIAIYTNADSDLDFTLDSVKLAEL